MREILIVGNETLGGEALMHQIRHTAASGPCRFHLVVPATPVQHRFTISEGESVGAARQRLDEATATLQNEGLEVTGEVGDHNPLLAVEDAIRHHRFDEVIVSTLPLGVSRWLKMDLPTRIRRHLDLPVTHVEAQTEAHRA